MPFEKAASIGGALRGFMGEHRRAKDAERVKNEKGSQKYEEFLLQTLQRPDLTPEGQQVAIESLRKHYGEDKDLKVNPLDMLSETIGTLYSPGDEKAVELDSIMSPGQITRPDRGMKYFRSPEDMARQQQEADRQAAFQKTQAEFEARAAALGSPLGQRLSKRAQEQAAYSAVTGGGTMAAEPRPAAPEALEKTMGPGGNPYFTPRSQAAGQQAWVAPQTPEKPIDPLDQQIKQANLERIRASTGASNALTAQRTGGGDDMKALQQEYDKHIQIFKMVDSYVKQKLAEAEKKAIATAEPLPPEERERLEDYFAEEGLMRIGQDPRKFGSRMQELAKIIQGGQGGGSAPSAGFGGAVQNETGGIWPPPQ